MKLILYLVAFTFLFGCISDDKNASGPLRVAGITINNTKPDTILLVVMSLNEDDLLEPLKKAITSYFKIPVKQISATLPPHAYYKPRDRYKADTLLRHLSRINNGSYRFTLGLTSEDISVRKKGEEHYGIFGLGTLNNTACVISTNRLKKNASKQKLSKRLNKVAIHEQGHNHGLKHCTTANSCVFKDAEGKISTVDNNPATFCRECLKKVQNI